eukprot:Seg3015.3 transcript_id=Seg3015.3/GoldUCD/mRNA.D3Y31 product="Testicular haploid expressed gene protein" protein_id=Seg3015.3/GoldUCD/D3Y31
MASMEEEKPRRRVDYLAKSKPVPAGFVDDRRSVYDGRYDSIIKNWDGGNVATTFQMTPKLEALLQPKRWHSEYVGDRPSPIWAVSKAAQNATASGQIESLSQPKSVHRDYKPEQSIFTIVSEAAKKASPSDRIELLARAKTYKELPIKPNSNWDWGEWDSDIPEAAKNGEASERVALLSRPKSLHPRHQECRTVLWSVSDSAKKTLPSLRLQKLARPKSRSQYQEDYHSTWYKVSPSAKTAHANPRVVELCTPIPRKVRQKKVISSKVN